MKKPSSLVQQANRVSLATNFLSESFDPDQISGRYALKPRDRQVAEKSRHRRSQPRRYIPDQGR